MILHFEVFFTPRNYDLEGRLCDILQADGPRYTLEGAVLAVLGDLIEEDRPPNARLGVDLCVADPGSNHPPPWGAVGRSVRAVLLTGDMDYQGERYARSALEWLADAVGAIQKKAKGRKITRLTMDELGVVIATIENPEDNPDDVEILAQERGSHGWKMAHGFAPERKTQG